MLSISHLAVLTPGYPSPALPDQYPFVRELAHAVARQGVNCTVIHPVAIHRSWKNHGIPRRSVEKPTCGRDVIVLRPRFFSFSARASFARLGRLNPGLWTLRGFTAAARRTLSALDIRPDALYGHFLYLAGAAAVRIGRQTGIPSFPGIGEGEFWTVAKFGRSRAKRDFDGAAGFLANSTLLKDWVSSMLGVPLGKIAMFPNGVDRALFFPRERGAMRRHAGFPPDIVLVASVGHFLYKKGIQRVAEAINGLPGIGGIYVGSGPLPPRGDNVLFNARVPHHQVPALLSAADMFVLPTLVEGSSNAIIEAMSCGLPIISSRNAFNDDLLSEDMSMRVNPLDVGEIRQAVVALRDDPARRRQMAEAALRRSRLFDVDDRARKIVAFMERGL